MDLAQFSPIDFEAELNPEQFAAVTAEPGPALVLAGAGSGKTRTLTYRVAYLLTQGVHPGSLMLLTFTNKAAREMLERVRNLTGAESPHWSGTFHSIGGRALRMFGKAIDLDPSYNILDRGDSEALLADVIRGIDAKYLKTKDNPKQKVVLDMISQARNRQLVLADMLKQRMPWFEDLTERIAEFEVAYTAKKRAQQVCDYDDLLELWLKLLNEDEDARNYFQRRFEHLLVDEYQDTNPLQASIVDAVGAHHNIMAVGDDAQCIYTWRGADFENIMTFPDRHPGTIIYKIETNYRSTPEILEFANGVLSAQPIGSGYDKALHPVRESSMKPKVVPVMDGRQIAQFIIAWLTENNFSDERVPMSEVAVLYRAHYQALDLQLELTRQGIPFQITSGIQFFEQAHVKDVVAQLRFAGNPKDQSAFMRFAELLPRVGPKSAGNLYALIHDLAAKNDQPPVAVMASEPVLKKVPADAREDWKDLAATLEQVTDAMASSDKPLEAVRIAVEGWYNGFIRTLHANWQSRVDDLDGLVSFAARFEDMNELLSQLVLMNSETANNSVEIDEECLRLTTVHQAKGLEYSVVFVIGMGDGLFPLKRAIEEGDVEEERRLFYVAVTRAKDQLYILYPMIAQMGGGVIQVKPSRFLNEVPADRYDIVRYRPSRSW